MQNIKNARAAGWKEVDGYIFPCLKERCAAAKAQVEATIHKLEAEKAEIGILWLDIERLEWPGNQEHNRKFITDMVEAAEKLKKKVGIYSNFNNWEAIVGASWEGVKHLPLWWAEYDGAMNFEHYKEFGGWKKPTIHQYSGSVKGPCGVSMDKNWKP
uniref:Uncharacterized protein n=1 Tax=Panagrolaimus superbus TaxID=310955 RepID=A0A914YIZ8_9BILA